MKLVIVESPTKAKTISKFLGKDYIIKASMGHVMDLPKSKLGIDVEHNFTPEYELVEDRKKILAELQKNAKIADTIILATDPDREGEAIASHIKDIFTSGKKASNNHEKWKRIVFHEITESAIEEAIKTPRNIDEHLVDAQTARRVLDRLVGYKLSPLLWQKVRRGLSAGRVQSVALRLIVEREREIEKFAKKEYWTVTALLSRNKEDSIEFELIEINGEKIESSETFKLYNGDYKVSFTPIANEEQAKKIENDLQTKLFVVADVIQKETHRSPQMPYTTSTLQQDASRRLSLSGKRTMSLAQKLYEKGFITYHRTDSVNMSSKAVFQIRDYVKKQYGEKYIPENPRFYKTKQKLAQEAHEAIRPTHVSMQMLEVGNRVGKEYAKLYDLIWRRAVASQMNDAVVESTTVFVDAESKNHETNYRFKTTGSVLVFDGFLKVNPYGLQDRKLPQYAFQETLNLLSLRPERHETPPPPRYNDASLVASLEEEGIGRPSTYATIISTIETRNYIEREEGRFTPTPIGVAVNDFLVKYFSDVDDIPFTSRMEDDLDAIAHGEKEWVPVIKEFYSPFEKTLEKTQHADRVKIEVEKTSEKCPECGNMLVIRTGRFGKFISCSNFPTCTFKKPFIETTKLSCPKCKEGTIIVKKTKRGKKFYGCSRYPECDFAAWKLKETQR